MAADPYVYTKMKVIFDGEERAYVLPANRGNEMVLQMLSKLLSYVHSNGYLFRMTKDKICWKEDGIECLVEFS